MSRTLSLIPAIEYTWKWVPHIHFEGGKNYLNFNYSTHWIHYSVLLKLYRNCSFIHFVRRRIPRNRFLACLHSLVEYVKQRSEDLGHVLCIVCECITLTFGLSIPCDSCYSHRLPMSPRFWDTALTCRTTSPVCVCEILGWCGVEGGYHGGSNVDSDGNACEQK